MVDIAAGSDCIDCTLTSITIRKVPLSTKERLRLQAAQAGMSLESYMRGVLQAVSQTDREEGIDLAGLAQSCFGAENGVDLHLPERGAGRPPLVFD